MVLFLLTCLIVIDGTLPVGPFLFSVLLTGGTLSDDQFNNGC